MREKSPTQHRFRPREVSSRQTEPLAQSEASTGRMGRPIHPAKTRSEHDDPQTMLGRRYGDCPWHGCARSDLRVGLVERWLGRRLAQWLAPPRLGPGGNTFLT